MEQNTMEIINRLKGKGIQFLDGLTEAEIQKIEAIYDIRFPGSLRGFYGFGVPFSEDEHEFPRWADFSEGNVAKIKERIEKPIQWLLFHVKMDFWLPNWGNRPKSADEAIGQFMEIATASPRLVPVYGHRYMPCLDGINDPPVISTVGRDTIYYGSNLREYWQNEFRDDGEEFIVSPNNLHIPFWSDIMNANHG